MNQAGKPRRILMLLENNSFPEDVRVLREVETLSKAGLDVSIICPTGDSSRWAETISGAHVYRYPATWEFDSLLGYIWEYTYSLSMLFLISVFVFFRRGFDAVHVHTPPDMTAIIAITYQLLGKKFVFDLHDLSPELFLARRGNETPNSTYRILQFFERVACRNADRLIATNETQRGVQIGRCGVEPERCYVVRNGPDEHFLSDVRPTAKFGGEGKIVLGYVGEIGIQDGVDYMIRVIDELRRNHGREDFLAVVVGDGPALQSLQILADEVGVTDLILFTGRIPFRAVPAHIASFDICLTPDPSNAYNDSCTTIKTMEYMALRKPIVCFRTLENELTAGDAALYADDNDISVFADLTIRLMDDPALRESMGETARKRIDDGLTWRHQSVQLIELYNNLFNSELRGSCRSQSVVGALEIQET